MRRIARYVRTAQRAAAPRGLATLFQLAVLGSFGVFTFPIRSKTSFERVACAARHREKTWDIGVLYFVYGPTGSQQLENFAKQTIFSARRMKHLNPSLKTGVWATVPTFFGADFDFIGKIEHRYVVNSRQWLTRINYMRCSPFKFTLALDSQALACSDEVASLLQTSFLTENFDISFNSKFAVPVEPTIRKQNFPPHNWMLLYRKSENLTRLFDKWFEFHAEEEQHSAGRDDQSSLFKVLKRNPKLVEVGRLSNNFAVAFVEERQGTDKRHRSTQELAPGPCHIFHLAVLNASEADFVCSKCAGSAVRVLVQMHKQNFKVAYNQHDLNEFSNSIDRRRAWQLVSIPFTSQTVSYKWPPRL